MVFQKDYRRWSWLMPVVALLVVFYCPTNVDGACTFPSDLAGEWSDSVKGNLYFNQTTGQITGYQFASFGSLTLTCWMVNDTVYIFESTEFEFFSLNFTAYFCWNITQVSSDLFYFYEYGNELPGANNERVQVYLPAFTRVYDVMCANPDIGLGTYRILYKNDSLSSSISNCPTELQAHWNYTVASDNNTDLCSNDVNQLDLCTDPTKMDFNSSECSTTPGYTENGTVHCLFHVYDSYSDIFYLALLQDGGADGTNTFLITCMIVSFGNPSYLMGTQYPTQCPATQNDSYVTSPGTYVSFIKTGSCSSEFPWWIIAVAVGSFLFLIILISCIIWFCCYRETEDEKKKRLMDEDDDERFNPDLFSRGDRPPYVSISIMDGDRSGSGGLYLADGQGGGPGGTDDVDGDGEKGLSEAQRKKEEAQKRRLDKRKRVFVIDKDGQVKKMWKEERESPDSGLEEDQLDGEGKSPEKTSSTNEEEEAEFAKKHGRKSLKSAKEIQEKGDRRPSQDKTRGKMTGMVSAKRSARLRESARSGPSKLKSERSWGSSNGDFEVVNFQEEDEDVFTAAVGTTAAVAVVSELDAKKDSKGDKGKKSKEKKETEKAQTSSEVEKSPEYTEADGAPDNTTSDKKDLQKAAAVGGAAAVSGAVAAKTAEIPKAVDQKKKAQVAQKAQGSKLKKKAPPKKEGSKEVVEKQRDEDAVQSENKADVGMQESVKPEVMEMGDSRADVAQVAVPAAAAASVVPAAGVTAAARVDHKQKDKAELRRLMVEKKTQEKMEKLKEKERLRLEKEEKLKKQKEEREARLKKEREEKKKAPIKKKYLSETADVSQEEQGDTVKEKEVGAKPSVEQESNKNKAAPEPEAIGAAAAAAATAPVIVVAAVKKSKKSKDKVQEEKSDNEEVEQLPKEEIDRVAEPAEEPERQQDADEKSEEQESSLSTTVDTDSGRSSVKSLDTSQSETASSTSAPLAPAEPTPLPDGMAMRREQSIMLDLDRTQSQMADAPLRRETSDLTTPLPGEGKRALGAVAEMIETARSQVEGRGLAEDDEEFDIPPNVKEDMEVEASAHQADSLPVRAAIVHPGLKEKEKGSKQVGAKETKDVRSQTTSEKQGSQKATPAKARQINVSAAQGSMDPEPESDESSSEESEEEEVSPLKKRPKPAGFMFPNESMAAQTFKTTGEVINAKPKRAKKKRRLPRKTSVDFLPDRTNLAFGLKPAQGKPGAKPGRVVPVVEKASPQTKKGEPKLLSVKELPAVRASAAPITLKDLTKKPPAVPAQQALGVHTLGVTGDGLSGSASPSTRKGRSESSSPARRTPLSSRRISETDNTSQLKLMTRLMSQSEMISEVEPSPRHSMGSRRSGKTRSDQPSRHSDPPPPRGMALGDLEEIDGVHSMTNGSSTPDELKTAREGEVLVGRPPTQHNYRRRRRDESPKRSHAVSRSHSDSRRGAPPPLSHRTQDSDETRFVKFRDGVLQQLGDIDQQELNRILYPGIKRYPDTPDNLRRGTPAYKSLNALQRIHRKKYRQVAPEPHVELPPIMNAYRGNEVTDQDDPRMRNWLEELYSDKKFFDKSLALQEDDQFIQNRTEEGRNYLLNRARFWSTQQPLVRPGTKMGTRGPNGQPETDTGGGSTPGLVNNSRSKSDERRRDWNFH